MENKLPIAEGQVHTIVMHALYTNLPAKRSGNTALIANVNDDIIVGVDHMIPNRH